MAIFGNLFGGGKAAASQSPNAPWFVGGGFGEEGPKPQATQGQGRDWGRTLSSFLINLSAARGNPAAQQHLQSMAQMARLKAEDANHDRDISDRWNLWQQQQEYEAAHPTPQQPNEFERALAAGGYVPGSPEYILRQRQRADNLANPIQGVPYTDEQGNSGIRFIRPSGAGGPPHVLQTLPPGAVPIPNAGGAGSGGPRTFPSLTIDRNNNPGALRRPGSTEFQRFGSVAEGVRAQEAQLRRYHGRGLRTITDIVETYAPRRSRGGDNTDEQVNNYIRHVATSLGVNPGDPIPAERIPDLANAMRGFETGRR